MILSYIVAMSAIEAILMWYAMLSAGPYRLRGLIAINMMLITLMASKTIVLFSHLTNIANILYASVMLSQYIIYKKFGKEASVATVKITIYALVSCTSLSYTLSLFPIVAGNELSAHAISTIADFSLAVLFASFFAFVFGQTSLIVALESGLGGLWAIFIAQMVDSAVFFPIAFGLVNGFPIMDALWTGFVFKLVVSVIIYVFYSILSRLHVHFRPI